MDDFLEEMIDQEDKEIRKIREQQTKEAGESVNHYDSIDMLNFDKNQQTAKFNPNQWENEDKKLLGGQKNKEQNFMKSQIYDSMKKLESVDSIQRFDEIVE